MQGTLFQSQHVSPAPLRRGHRKARLSLGWELERQTGSAGPQRPILSLCVCRGHEHLQSGPQRQQGGLCVSTVLLEDEVWPWDRLLHYVLKRRFMAHTLPILVSGDSEPLCQNLKLA